MSKRRCPKCNFGRIQKLGEIVAHDPMPNGGWKTYKDCDCWECQKCMYTWSTKPGQLKELKHER